MTAEQAWITLNKVLSYLLSSFVIIVKYLNIGKVGRTQKLYFNVAE